MLIPESIEQHVARLEDLGFTATLLAKSINFCTFLAVKPSPHYRMTITDPSWDARLRGERFFALAKNTHLADHLAAYAEAIDHRLGARPHGRDAEWQAIVNQMQPSLGRPQ